MVKADRALTLFMINTLAENARKYTPEGGTIKVYARTTEDAYVEISVEDNGRGISEEDVAYIIGEKVYDSRVIGMKNAADPEVLKENKGSGFGLMNCKGIIEKYKKTNDLFRGCVLMWRVNWGREAVFIFVCLRECVKRWGYCCFACCFRWGWFLVCMIRFLPCCRMAIRL